ncbi:MAG: DegT/DnrJ/EryC1/StrS family aminotransferase [Mycobacteriales bacterium]
MTDSPTPIPMARVEVGQEEADGVLDVLRSGMLAQGPRVAELESAFAELHGVAHGVAVNNGTTALVAAMQALGVGPGDEVITTPFSFIATLNAILEAGGRVRFADIGPDYNIDPVAIEPLVNDNTRVIMPVHLYGLPADMAPITELAQRRGVSIVEDAAQSVGATYQGKPVGSFGVGSFSLYGTKNITCGEGGMLTTDDETVADRLRLLRNQGMRARYQYEIAGHNYRLTDIQAAIVLPQLRRLKAIIEARQANAQALTAGLSGIPGLLVPVLPEGRTHVWHQYTVRITPEAAVDRDGLSARLSEAGIGNGFFYPRLMHDYDCYRGHPLVTFDETPVAKQVASEVISLPVHPSLSPADVERIIDTVRTVLAG